MVHKISEKISLFLISKGLPKEHQSIYAYGAECLINQVLCIIPLLIWSYFFHCVPEMIIYQLCYTILRNHIGGYHAKKQWHCVILSILVSIISISSRFLWFINSITYTIAAIFLLCCFVLVVWKAPVQHPNHPIPLSKQDRERTISIIILLIEICSAVILYFFNTSYCGTIISAVCMATIFFVLGYFFNIRITN